LSEEEITEWLKRYQYAVNFVGENRDELVEKTCNELETNLELIGATAIEDKLQDGVPETIHYLIEAGIKVWVLTGDKQETAVNIGYSSKLLKPNNMEVIFNNADNADT